MHLVRNKGMLFYPVPGDIHSTAYPHLVVLVDVIEEALQRRESPRATGAPPQGSETGRSLG